MIIPNIKLFLCVFAGLYFAYNFFFNKNIYTFSNYEQWVSTIDNKQIYIFDEKNYCIKTNTNLFYNYYSCCQNVQILKNNLDISLLYNNQTEINSDIQMVNYINTVNNEYSSWFTIMMMSIIYLVFISLCVVVGNIYQFIISIFRRFSNIFKINHSNKKLNDNNIDNNNNFKINTPFDISSIFENLFGSETEIKVLTDKDNSITIDNFIGCANIKKDINKLILQINYEELYKLNNCELPKGLLLLGPPGVGKTHLVKTIINATGMKHIFISGSDFNKKFVGSGTSTVEKLFKKARENKPCLIFVDEADTILKSRSHSESSAASIEFNSTICEFLAEMDSLKTESGVIVIFASNMNIEYIDKGIIRAGRIDQIINISVPTFEERIDLFKMYLGNLYDEKNININKISKLSYGLTGSDIKKIINLIKINKVHQFIDLHKDNPTLISNYNNQEDNNQEDNNQEDNNQEDNNQEDNNQEDNNQEDNNQEDNNEFDGKIHIQITTDDLDKEISKCILGMERERKINELNKKIIAYHEAGHAVLGFLIANSIIPTKICISINSKSLGYTLFPQDDDDLLVKTTISQLLIEVMILYGGRISEKIFIGDITCGGEDDYSKARKILKRLLLNGMLVPENNYIDFDSKDSKLNDQMESQLKRINKIIINEIESLLKDNSEIVHWVSNMIIEYGSITSDDIYDMFKNNNMSNKIGSYDISFIKNKINLDIM